MKVSSVFIGLKEQKVLVQLYIY